MENNYFFVDGSSLLADIKRLRKSDATFDSRRLDVGAFARYFTTMRFTEFHGASYRRFTVYFVDGDDRLEHDLIIPDPTMPGAVNDLRIERCGRSIKAFRTAQAWLEANNAPDHVRECVYRSEKAVDTQICADALQLAALRQIDRLFLYTNDFDFVPLCRAFRHLGLNINLFRLTETSVNADLVSECDAFHVPDKAALNGFFMPLPPREPKAPAR